MSKNVTANRYTELKNRVKAECTRRAHTGSVSGYAASTYDYSITPVAGGVILHEHRDKIVTPLNAVNATTVPNVSGQNVVSDNDMLTMEAMVSNLESYTDITINGSSGCSASCTGLCYSNCTGGCRGNCVSSCATGCATGCAYSCSSYCANSCNGYCSGDCSGYCSGYCSGSCSGDGCTAYCGMSCWSACGSGCGSSCGSGCSGSCTTYCANSCKNGFD